MTTKRVINLRQLADDALGIEGMATDIVDGAERGLLRSLPLIVSQTPVDTGQMASSWKVERVAPESVLLLNEAPHAAVVEFGARPFTPPIGPLLQWAKRVLQDPQTPIDPDDPASYSKEVRSLAYAVQQKISREGMRPHHIIEGNMEAILDNIVKEWKGEAENG